MTQLIDLGKLRFHFAGDWSGSTTYESNDIVKYGGNVYVYTYGLKTSGNLPTSTTYWALMVEGFKFKGVFDTAVQYRVGDGVAHGGKVFVAVLDSTGQTPPNTTYWSQFADGIQYEGAYTNVRAYQKNDVVTLGGAVYIAKVDTTGNNPTNVTYWDRFVDGISPQSVFNGATAYVVGDMVPYGSNIYRCIQNTTANLPTNATYWAPFLYGFSNRGVWSTGSAYKIGEVVTYGGSTYQAKADNSGVNPATTPLTWDKLTYGFKNRGSWATSVEYVTDDVIAYGGNTYIAMLPHASTTFQTDLDAGKWQKFNSGIRWRGLWTTGTAYLKDDIIKDAVGSAYIATQDHTAGAAFGADSTAGKWTVFVLGGSDILPAVQASDAGQSLTVKSDGSALDWLGATQSDKVFYVAPHGSDLPTSGKNLSSPFASIKYATTVCGEGATIFVKTGTYEEQLPITIPANTAIVGDNQRTVIVQPKTGNSDDGVTPNAQSSMFLMSNASILNKMTFRGMTGWVPGTTPADVTTSTIKGVVVRLNPASPITHKSPYVLECSYIGTGGIGALIDGSVHTTGAKTMIFHGYTVISDNGIGYWVKDGGKSEIVSCFTYYTYFGYTASGGGFIRALNGNNSYGTWGATSRGFDSSETALTGTIVGEQLPFTYGGGLINIGDTVSNGAGATAIVTNVQYSSDKVYIKNRTGNFGATQSLTFTSGGIGTALGNAENQRGFVLVANGFSQLPKPGASISLAGDTYAYVIQSTTNTWVNSSSDMVLLLAQEKPTGSASGTAVTIRYKYSQIRLTGHDFLSIGTGGVTTTNYPGTPTQPAAQGNETDEQFPGRVFYVSTDQDGNFRVGEYFRIDQSTGKATLNASAFDLSGLSSLRLGSIGAQLGEQINEFSSDSTMGGNSNLAVPTEYAVKTYVDGKAGAVIPSQTGNSGKYLGTNGTAASWQTIQLLPNHPAGEGQGFLVDTAGTTSWFPADAIFTRNFPSFSAAATVTSGFYGGTQSINTFQAVNNAGGAVTHTFVSGTLPPGLSLQTSGLITGSISSGSGTATFTIRAVSNSITIDKAFTWNWSVVAPGQALFGTNVGTGTFSWTAPAGVTSVSVVAVGGGSSGGTSWSYAGGSGGGLGWKNNIAVTPGQSYTVRVGRGPAYSNGDNYGGNSYFIDTNTVAGGGGSHASFGTSEATIGTRNGYGGGYVGEGGGQGGNASSYQGGGGAGGYTGRGGNQYSDYQPNPTDSGAGGGGGYYSSTYGSGGGGGVGLNGRGGTGSGGNYMYNPFQGYNNSYSYGSGGAGGSGGENGGYGENPFSSSGQYGPPGGNYGGGGGGPGSSGWPGGRGGQGGVRIIWGGGRSFPMNAADA
jgi:hypothetical protein